MKDYAYLIFADSTNNHNKFYEMKLNDDNSIDVNYGRIGETVVQHHYTPHEKDFHVLKSQKMRKGYEDVTLLHAEQGKNEALTRYDDFKKIEDKRVDDFLRLMFERQVAMVQKNYTKPTDVNDRMIQSARMILDELERMSDQGCRTWEFNEELKKLFYTIPRRMGDVSAYIAHDTSDFSKIIAREDTLINALENVLNAKKLSQQSIDSSGKKEKSNIMEASGIHVETATYKEEDEVIRKLKDGNDSEKKFLRAVRIENLKTQKSFDKFMDDNKGIRTALLWHGSPNKNWWSIATNGLSLKYARNGMFGEGLYFAPKSGKSAGYMSTGSYWRGGNDETGYLALFEVAVGKSYTPHSSNSWSVREGQSKLRHEGCDSVWAKSGTHGSIHLYNDEVIVYREEQQTIKYLVEVSNHSRNIHHDMTKDLFEKSQFENIQWKEDGFSLDVDVYGGKTHYELTGNKLSVSAYGKDCTSQHSGSDLWWSAREIKKHFFESEAEYQKYLEDPEARAKFIAKVSPPPLKEDEEIVDPRQELFDLFDEIER